MSASKKIIYLIRHGETTGDVEGRYGGDYDDDLTDRGVDQCRQLAESLADAGIERVLTSPLQRAKHAGQILADKFGAPTEILPGLKERNAYGVITGLTKAEALERYPAVVAALAPTATVEGAEPYREFVTRVSDALDKLAARPEQVIAAVTHGGFIRALSRSVLTTGEIKELDDCAYLTLIYNPDKARWTIQKFTGASLGIDTTDNTIRRAKVLLWRRTAAGLEFLITREPGDEDWSLPGGTKDVTDASMAETGARELREELGLDFADRIVDLGMINEHTFSNPDHWKYGMTLRTYIMTAEYRDEPMELDDEVGDLKWITPEQMTEYPLQSDLPELIEKALVKLG